MWHVVAAGQAICAYGLGNVSSYYQQGDLDNFRSGNAELVI